MGALDMLLNEIIEPNGGIVKLSRHGAEIVREVGFQVAETLEIWRHVAMAVDRRSR